MSGTGISPEKDLNGDTDKVKSLFAFGRGNTRNN
jgi:hypothetical protein